MSCSQESTTFSKLLSAHSAVLAVFTIFMASDALADGWQSRAPVPGPRAAHSIVWTGQEAIVWGGGVDGVFLNTGARYSPVTDAWQVTSPYGAPAARWFHAAVWTGSEMIIWGGQANFSGDNNFNDGARYNPTTDTWKPLSTYGAPTPRSQCGAVWTGEEMIVWGGETEGGAPLSDGAAYNPATDSWRPISGSGLSPRMEPTTVWTGSEMIVFGGVDATKPGWLSYGDGARYNPFTDSWTPLPSGGVPSSRTGHTAVWTGERMIVWGGRELPSDTRINDGASYHPGLDTWSSLSPYGAPQARALHAAVWTGSEMIIWGGDSGSLLDTGARYNPANGVWTPMTQNNAPRQRMFWRPDHGIWTGRGMLVCAGSDYPASLDSTALYTIFDPLCPPIIVEQPQSVTVTEDEPVTLTVGAQGCVQGGPITVSKSSLVPGSERFEFQTGARSGQLLLDMEFYTVPDSIRVYYEGELIFDTMSTGYGQFWVSYGPGNATSVEIVMNEETGPSPASVWEYTVRYRPPPVGFQWHKNSVAIEGQTNAVLHFERAAVTDSGDYTVLVLGNGGTTLSVVAVVTVETVDPADCVAVPSDLVAWWSAEGNADGRSGTNDGVLSGGVSYAPGRVGNAFVFPIDGDGSVKFAASPVLDVGTSDGFTVEGWIRRTSPTPSGPIAEWSDGSRWGSHFWVLNDALYANLTSPGGSWHAVLSSTQVPVGVWNHVALCYEKENGTGRLYLNGTKVGEDQVGSFSPETAFDFYLGRRPAPDIYRDSFEGLLDEFSLYRRALTTDEIAAIHSAGAAGKCVPPTPPTCVPAGLVAWWRADGDGVDVTGAHNGELLYGTTFLPGVAGQAFHFDLSRARVNIPDSDAFKLTNSLSFEGWINVSSYAPGIIFIRGDNRGGLDPYHMSIQPSGQLHWGINTADNNFAFVQSPNPVPTDVWMHVAAVLDGATGNMGLYINGSLVSQTNTTLRPLRDLDPNWEPAVGIGNSGGTFHHFPFHGSVDDWALYSRALNGSEIALIYQNGPNGKCVTNVPPRAFAYDVSQDFSSSGNPTGAWSYGYSATLGGEFHLLTFAKSYAANNGVPISGWQVTDVWGPSVNRVMGNGVAVSEGGAFTAPSGTVYVWPGNEGSPGVFGIIRFAVPAGGGGVYRIESAARSNFDGPVSGDSDFHILKNGQEVFGQFVAPNSATGWSNALALAAGDSVDFVVGKGADGSPDHSSLKVQASITLLTNMPPPAHQVFDLSSDFSLKANPNGAWSYGHLTGSPSGSFELLNTTKSFGAENAVPISVWFLNDNKPFVAKVLGPDTAVSYLFNAPAGTVYFGSNPDATPHDFAAIRFTVPAVAGGLYRLTTQVRALYDGVRSADADFHVLKNGVELFARLVPPNSGTSYSNELSLVTGDRIDFVAGRGTNGFPDTGLKIAAALTLVSRGITGIDAVSLHPGGGVRVTGHAPLGMLCRIERSADLKEWELVGVTSETSPGVFEIIDLHPSNGTSCFYRMVGSE